MEGKGIIACTEKGGAASKCRPSLLKYFEAIPSVVVKCSRRVACKQVYHQDEAYSIYVEYQLLIPSAP